MNEGPIFDHEKLDVYQIELLFIAWVAALLTEIRTAAPGFHREVCDQLDRASLSSLLNTAEGNGKRQGKQRAKFFDDARGSAVECAACLGALSCSSFVLVLEPLTRSRTKDEHEEEPRRPIGLKSNIAPKA